MLNWIYLFVLCLVLAEPLLLRAENPNNHLMLLQDNDKIASKSVPIDQEDPYFLLSGEADKALAEEDYPTAVLRLREALKVDPSNPGNVMLLSNLGLAYNMLDQDSLSYQAYSQALEIAPAMTAIRNNRALLLLKMGHDQQAFADFTQVIERDSVNVIARYYRGIMMLYGGNMQGAESDFDVLVAQDPDAYNAQAALAMLYSLTGREKQAIPYLKKIVARDPSPEFYATLAGCLLQLQEYSEAAATIAEALEVCGDDPELYYYRAWLHKDTFQNEAAHEDARRAIALGADPRRVNRLFERP